MKFEPFVALAEQLWQEIPAEYRAGVDGVQVERAALPQPGLDGVYTLGECSTEVYPSGYGDAETTRSMVVLYYGSFWRLSRQDAAFDWRDELWQTLMHELQHHLESLADEDALGDVDYAADQNFRRLQGDPFDPDFFLSGEPQAGGWYRIEDDWFLDCEPVHGPLEFSWEGKRYRVQVPPANADVLFLELPQDVVPAPATLTVVVRARRSWTQALRAWWRGQALTIEQVEIPAEAVSE